MPIRYASLLFRPGAGLEDFLAAQQDPSSPEYHHWLTPDEFGARFGLSDDDLAQIHSWLRGHGLTIHDTARGRLWVTFSGTAAQVANTFGTQFRRYRVNNAEHFANATDLQIPLAFQTAIDAVDGLTDFTPDPLYRKQPLLTSGSVHYLAPDDLAVIYNIQPLYDKGLDGTGQKIAIIGRTDVDLADMRAFRTRFNLPPKDPQITLFGPDPGTNSGDQFEANLDLQWAAAIARNADIIYVNSTSVNTSAQYAVDQNLAPVMSFSYGSCENAVSNFQQGVARQAAAQGITWMVSSGDSGAATCDRSALTPQASRGATVAYPSSIPEVVSVGGLMFDEGSGNYWSANNSESRASALGYIPETVWNESAKYNDIAGGGGGASTFFQKPVWQSGPGVPNDGARDLPDISLSAAAGHDGYEVIYRGAVSIVGGTSASSPAFAGMIAILNQKLAADSASPSALGNINPTLYRLAQSHPEAFHDIVTGDNKVACVANSPNCVNGMVGYPATPGYDLASGLGSVNLANLVNTWNSANASATTLTATPADAAPEDSVLLTANVTGKGPLPTGTVTFVAADNTLGSVALGAASNSAVATLSVSSFRVAGGSGTVGALYSGDASYLPSRATATVNLKVPATGSFVIPTITPDPVVQVGSSWPWTITLTEKNGVPTTVTAFTVGANNDLPLLPTKTLAAKGSISVSLVSSGLTVPVDRAMHFEGVDADGSTWTRDITVSFVGPADKTPVPLAPSLLLSVAAATAQQDPNADPSCSFSQQVTIQENSGYSISLAGFTAAGNTFSPTTFASVFGTTHIAPWSAVSGTICLSGITPPVTRTYSVIGVTDSGQLVSASASVRLNAASTAPAQFSVAKPTVTLTATDGVATGNIDLKFSVAAPWTASIQQAGFNKWLSTSDTSGMGDATIHLNASAKALSPGVYTAWVTIQATDALPQTLQIPVSFVVGASSAISITGVGNAASGAQVFAPGQLIAIYGSGLAPDTAIAGIQPLPFTLNGVSATINGISAPLWFVSAGQINLQIPNEVGAGTAFIGINNNGKVTSFSIPISATAPGIFAYQGSLVPLPSAGAGNSSFCFITGDGDQSPFVPTGASPAGSTSIRNLPTSRASITMTIGGEPANIVFHGIVPGLIGVTQVNFTVPLDLKPGNYPVVVTVGGVSSAPVNITVTGPSGNGA
jgi:uncharacterized protein (TIGR03437 family)